MKVLWHSVVLGCCCLLFGCRVAETAAPISFPEGSFQLETEEILVDRSFAIKVLKIRTRGQKQVTVKHHTRTSSVVTYSGAPLLGATGNELAEAEYVIAVALAKPAGGDGDSQLMVELHGRANGFSGGGTSQFSIGKETALGDVVAIEDLSGDFPEDSLLRIGRVLGFDILLTVGPRPPPVVLKSLEEPTGAGDETSPRAE